MVSCTFVHENITLTYPTLGTKGYKGMVYNGEKRKGTHNAKWAEFDYTIRVIYLATADTTSAVSKQKAPRRSQNGPLPFALRARTRT